MSMMRVSLLTASVLFLASVSPLKQVLDISRLSPSQIVEIEIRGKKTPVTLNANDKSKPLLNTNIKKSIRVVNSSSERQEFLSQGVSIDSIRALFLKHGVKTQRRFFDDFTIVKNFTHGIKEYTAEDILKTKMNDQHHSYYWYAIIPKAVKVSALYVQRDWFDSGVGTHGQLRFVLNSPIVLVPQDRDVMGTTQINDMTGEHWKTQFLAGQNSPIALPGDLTYSLFALRYAGGPNEWSFTTGVGGAFANAYTLSSTSHNVIYLATTDYVEQHSLIQPETLGTKTFQSVLERSDRLKEKNIYHLIFNSCITEMNAALSAKGKAYPVAKLGVRETSFNSYRFVELLKPLFNNPDGEDPSLNAEFGTIVQEKIVHPKVNEFKDVVTSQHLDDKITEIALQLAPLTYKELAQLMKNISQVQSSIKSQGGLLTPEQLVTVLDESKMKLPENLGGLNQAQQLAVMTKLLNDPRIIQTFEILKQRL